MQEQSAPNVFTGIVLLTPRRVPGIVGSSELDTAAGIARTQLIQIPTVEMVSYGNLQVIYAEQSPQQLTLSITQPGNGSLSRLLSVAEVAVKRALASQTATALGINFADTPDYEGDTAEDYLTGLLKPQIIQAGGHGDATLAGAGIKLFYDMTPWRITLTLEPNLNDPSHLVAAANFNTVKPNRAAALNLIKDIENKRKWFKRTVDNLFEEAGRVNTN